MKTQFLLVFSYQSIFKVEFWIVTEIIVVVYKIVMNTQYLNKISLRYLKFNFLQVNFKIGSFSKKKFHFDKIKVKREISQKLNVM